jgi:hypothetical protein
VQQPVVGAARTMEPHRVRDAASHGVPVALRVRVAGSVGPHLHIAAKSGRMLLERHLSRAGASFGTWTGWKNAA